MDAQYIGPGTVYEPAGNGRVTVTTGTDSATGYSRKTVSSLQFAADLERQSAAAQAREDGPPGGGNPFVAGLGELFTSPGSFLSDVGSKVNDAIPSTGTVRTSLYLGLTAALILGLGFLIWEAKR